MPRMLPCTQPGAKDSPVTLTPSHSSGTRTHSPSSQEPALIPLPVDFGTLLCTKLRGERGLQDWEQEGRQPPRQVPAAPAKPLHPADGAGPELAAPTWGPGAGSEPAVPSQVPAGCRQRPRV